MKTFGSNLVKYLIICSFFGLMAVVTTDTTYANQRFKDVPANHYAYEAINWAYAEGIVSGYGNGDFGPNNKVTEGQFAIMASNFYNLESNNRSITKEQGQNALGNDEHYNKLAAYSVPLNGYFNNSFRNSPIKRGVVAQVLGYISGNKLDLTSSIDYMLNNHISSGQNPTYKDLDTKMFFGSDNDVTRGQVVIFLYQMHKNNLKQIDATTQNTKEEAKYKNVNDLANIGKDYVDISLTTNKENKTEVIDGNKLITTEILLCEGYLKRTIQSTTYNGSKSGFNLNIPRENCVPFEGWPNTKIPISDRAAAIKSSALTFFMDKLGDDTINALIQAGFKIDSSYETITEDGYVEKNLLLGNSDSDIIIKTHADGIISVKYNADLPSVVALVVNDIFDTNYSVDYIRLYTVRGGQMPLGDDLSSTLRKYTVRDKNNGKYNETVTYYVIDNDIYKLPYYLYYNK